MVFCRNNHTPRPRFLCIAYAFPPMNRSGTHRTLGFVGYLCKNGWNATVLTAEPKDDPLDSSLEGDIPANARVIRVPWTDIIEQTKTLLHITNKTPSPDCPEVHHSGCYIGEADRSQRAVLREWVSRLMITPDSRTGWILPSVRAGLEEVRLRRPKIIYSSAPCMSAHLIAMFISRWTRIPWIADFRDPWVDNPYRGLGFATLRRWDAWLEKMVMRQATRIVCATPTMTHRFCERHPFVRSKCTTILNGYDAKKLSSVKPVRIASVTDFIMTHAGQFYGPRTPHVWFRALRRMAKDATEIAKRVRFLLIGTPNYAGRSLHDWASDYGVERHVEIIGQRCHQETLSYLAGSDALALAAGIGYDSELQVPNKLFEYLALRRPIVATCEANSPVNDILREACADAVTVYPDDDVGLACAMITLAKRRRVGVPSPWQNVDAFDRRHRAKQLAALFTQVTGIAPQVITTPETKVASDIITRTRSEVRTHDALAGICEAGPRPGELILLSS